MSIRIKISYAAEDKDELDELLQLISPILKKYKVSNNRVGRYRKAYAELEAVRKP